MIAVEKLSWRERGLVGDVAYPFLVKVMDTSYRVHNFNMIYEKNRLMDVYPLCIFP